MDREIAKAQFVLMICTDPYHRRVMGQEVPGVGHGIAWEGSLIYQHIYTSGSLNTKFIPIIFDQERAKYIPTPVQSATRYCVSTEDGYEQLYSRLIGKPPAEKPPLGKRKPLPEREVKTTFGAIALQGEGGLSVTTHTIHADTINPQPPFVPDTAVYGVPDWPIHDLFYYLRPDINLRGPTSEFDEIGNDVLDKLSTGQLSAWGREMVRAATTTYLNLAPIDRSYWKAARFIYIFLLDGHERDIHVTQNRPSSLPDYGDLRVNRAEAVKLWTHPWRERWKVTAITLVAHYSGPHEPDEVTIPCQSLSLFDAEVKTEYGADGISQQRSVIKPAFILATGIDLTVINKLTWMPQQLLFNDSRTGTQKEFLLISVDSVNQPDTAKFFIHGHHP
jgi:hypothetical protein